MFATTLVSAMMSRSPDIEFWWNARMVSKEWRCAIEADPRISALVQLQAGIAKLWQTNKQDKYHPTFYNDHVTRSIANLLYANYQYSAAASRRLPIEFRIFLHEYLQFGTSDIILLPPKIIEINAKKKEAGFHPQPLCYTKKYRQYQTEEQFLVVLCWVDSPLFPTAQRYIIYQIPSSLKEQAIYRDICEFLWSLSLIDSTTPCREFLELITELRSASQQIIDL